MEQDKLSFNWLREKIENLEEKIYRFEKWQKAAVEKNIQDIKRIRILEDFIGQNYREDIHHIYSKLHLLDINRRSQDPDKKPYICPACMGRGYWRDIESNIACGGRCNVCEGKSIIWG